MVNYDLVIIGGGSAGMSAAIEAYDLGIRNLVILEKNAYLGGILDQCIHNGFGLEEFKEELTGPEFMSRFAKQVNERKIPVKYGTTVTNLSKDKVITYINKEEGKVQIGASSIILATGCYERSAGAIMLGGDRPAGIYTAGQAQLYLNNYGYLVGKKVFILGSGDIGLIMARRMTLEGAKVLGVAELMPYSAGLNRNIVQCLQDYNIPLYLSTTVKMVIGKERLEKIILAKVDEKFNFIPNTEFTVECDTLLLSVGLLPNVSLIQNLPVSLSSTRGMRVNEYMEGDIPGLFSCGNVLHVHDLVDMVVKEARQAAKGAYLYLHGQLEKHENVTLCLAEEGISYLLPQVLYLDEIDEDVTFKLRVRKPYKEIYIDLIFNDQVIKSIYKNAIVPSEMEIFKIKRSLFTSNQGKLIAKVRHKNG